MPCTCNANCSGCPYVVKSTDIKVNCDYVDVHIPKVVLKHAQPLCVILAQPIPAEVTANMKVLIRNSELNLALVTPRHSFVYGDQLCSRKMLRTRIASDTGFAYLINTSSIKRTNHKFPVIPGEPPYVAPEAQEQHDAEEEGA